MQHTEVPKELDNRDVHHLCHGDKIIYAAIRRFMNKDSRECFPAIRTIAKTLQCTPGKVSAALDRLIETGFVKRIESKKNRNSNHYLFPKTKFDNQFEMFTTEFLELNLPLNVKEYYMDIQQYLYGKETGIGKCSLSNVELSRRTGWTIPSIKKYNIILIENNLLEEETTNKQDEAGFPIIMKRFDLNGLNQAILWIKHVTEKINEHDEDIAELKERNQILENRIKALERRLSIQENSVQEVEEFSF